MKAHCRGAIQALIYAGANTDTRGIDGDSRLSVAMLACVEGKVNCLRKLIENKMDLKQLSVGSNQPDPLSLSVVYNQAECLRLILDQPLEWKGRSSKGESSKKEKDLIILAARHNSIACLEILIEYGVYVNAMDEQGRNALYHAAVRGYETCLKMLIDAGASIVSDYSEPRQETAIHAAAANGNFELLTFLLPYTDDEDLVFLEGLRFDTPFMAAVRRGKAECVDALMKAGLPPWKANIDSRWAEVEDESVMRVLARHRHLCDKYRNQFNCVCADTIVHYGTQWPHSDSEEHLAEICDDCNPEVCGCDIDKCIELICKHTQDVLETEPDEDEKKAIVEFLNKGLDASICYDKPEMLKAVLVAGAIPNILIECIQDVELPMAYAVLRGSVDCLKVLLEYGRTFLPDRTPIDYETCNNMESVNFDFNRSVLFFAAEIGQSEITNCLLDFGVDIKTVLHQAFSCRQNIETMRFLFQQGATPTLTDGEVLEFFDPDIPPSYHAGVQLPTEHYIEMGELLLGAGFPKTSILPNFDRGTPWCSVLSDAEYEKIKEFVKRVKSTTLKELSFDTLRRHLLVKHPDSNLFHLIPKLPIPQLLKETMLYFAKV